MVGLSLVDESGVGKVEREAEGEALGADWGVRDMPMREVLAESWLAVQAVTATVEEARHVSASLGGQVLECDEEGPVEGLPVVWARRTA
jgi:hypothetical protein